MKKVKIMLTAIIVLGTVGGVLAYKVKRNTAICYTTIPANGICPANTPCGTLVFDGTTVPAGGVLRCTTATINGTCPAFCPVRARTIVD